MQLATRDLPEEDGADFYCSAVFYPYSAHDNSCRKIGMHLLTEDAYEEFSEYMKDYGKRHPKNVAPEFTGPMLCANHYRMANEFMVGGLG